MIAKDSSSITSDLTHCEKDLFMISVELVTILKQISEFYLETILMGSSEVIIQNIVDLFRVAIKLKRKEILC
ncbi:5788_t:CDS:2 [Funneliformis mosseae]|uniref:5788_t:CDS:1 n=1 Tax=Funneliformis mosseae TaxID=27381 RepID=A0A9N9HG42_FUNMO|nr:5788_t:CDS:2 [Funneliformis mosseae]